MSRLDTALSRCATRARVAQRKAHRRKGFNLVEAAIVLGVVGLVIGGIWVAANSINEKILIKDANTVMLTAFHVTNKYRREFDNAAFNADMAEMIALEGLPGNFKLVGTSSIRGNGVEFLFLYRPTQGLKVTIRFYNSSYSAWSPNPRVCTELSKYLVDRNFTAGIPSNTVVWRDINFAANNWLPNFATPPKPDFSSIMNFCKTNIWIDAQHLYN